MTVKEIIIPIVSAVIGGMFTFLGVFITIQHEKKKEKFERLLANKPLFYKIDYRQVYDDKSAVDFCFGVGNFDEKEGQIFGIIKNTDNAIFIIDGISVNGKIYKSIYGDVVDKNQIINLYVNVSNCINNDDEIIMIIKDIMNNRYEYKIEVQYKNVNYAEMIGFKEMKS